MTTSLVAPLREAPFRALVTGRSLAQFGNAVAPFALAFAVVDLTGSAVDLGIVVGARSLANVLLLLFGGMLADRLPRSVILQGTETAAALTQAAVAASVLCGFASVPLLAGLGFVNGAVSAISLPAAAALTPSTVPGSQLTQANALVRLLANTGRIAGAGLAGVVVAFAGSGWALAGNSLLFLGAALAYRRIRLPRGERVPGSRPLAELAEGWREFRARAWVWLVVLQFMIVNAATAGALLVIGPLVADDTLGRTGWGFALAMQTAGSLLGGVLAAHWQPRRMLFTGVAVVSAGALPMLALGWKPSLLPLLAAMFLAGVALEQFSVAWDVSLQENIPPDKLARVYSYDMLGSFVAMPLGQIAAGPLAEHAGRSATLFGGAALVVVATALVLCSSQVRGLVRRVPAGPG
ncbi:membrane spanning protein [Amycolatopsis mediterranei S699]|uniref:Membrane spanning protein n=2 Tax=Amycolatopsis mediterranei TaxID=33910 RepID=A0A9R0UCZ6_AMYMS|nr:MFS transporter [Amycolatopsis mediterranei]ADJ49574.1 putative membrane spanning protein [Amycolatopsis mediterranei U32]AEK46554.1 membrane spanning protein [Amycolatopsis mediterranei S699]AFO81283.1 membrane spanning protein [Amycolatopsis mediterranei S699]AGT88411.1 membrane spanning protein [Amycolatopsis mediterranei RB]KDO12794.1 membrane protein [Amycolatopsis mediterranei]